MHDSLNIANRFLSLAEEQGDSLTPMQLLKLVYIAHGWMYGLYGRPLISDEVQAWQYGPVIPKLYDAIKHFHSHPVQGRLYCEAKTPLTMAEDSIVKQVYDIYGHMSGPALSRLTHMGGTPWERTYVPGSFGKAISPDLIENHYRAMALKEHEGA